ncbi:MAG: Obg family GTPase CgtA, partial [Patescibacteria group bacterium]
VRWLHLKGLERAGPAGGDGGRGGDIILEGVRDLAALAHYRYAKKFRAENGESGGNKNCHGKDGEPVVLKVPVGSVATITTTGEVFELLEHGQRITVMRGGVGGYGNAHFRGAENRNPIQSTPGKAGESGDIRISLKLIADAGFIGFPNAGKSSLLNSLTRARSKVGAYPFTTLDPHLGEFYGYVLADIPGLIEGASSGRGLGSRFLKHIERTGLLVHLVSAEQEDPIAAYRAIRSELQAFGRGLPEKHELVVLSKVDTLPEDEVEALRKKLTDAIGVPVVALSIIDDNLLKQFSDTLSTKLSETTRTSE